MAMSHKWLRLLQKIAEFEALPRCRVCDSRACDRPGNCDDHAQIERAIMTAANIGGHLPIEDYLKAFPEKDVGIASLVYRAGEILARK